MFGAADARIASLVVELGCTGAVHVICPLDDPRRTAPDAELDALRRAQARDLKENRITAIQARLPLLTQLDAPRAWSHRYDAALAYERANLAAAAPET